MIDEKKIEEAQDEIFEDKFLLNGEEIEFDNDAKEEMFYKEDIKEAIKLGANWAIEQFLKDLWHDVSEKPRNVECLLELNVKWNANSEIEKVYIIDWFGSLGFDGRELKRLQELNTEVKLSRWLYVDDLFPKKGDEE